MSFNLNMNFNLGVRPASTMAPSFTPADLSNLRMWHDASNTSSITHSSGVVSQINDLSGNSFHGTQGDAPRQPTTNSDTVNGLNAITFDTTDFLFVNALNPASADLTNFFVCQVDASDNEFDSIWSLNNANDFQIDAGGGATFGFQYRHDNLGTTTSPIAFNGGGSTYGTAHIYVVILDSTAGTVTLIRDGGTPHVLTGYNGNLSSNQNYHIMANRGLTQEVDGLFCEDAFYTDVKSTADLNSLGNALGTKWGISWTDIT